MQIPYDCRTVDQLIVTWQRLNPAYRALLQYVKPGEAKNFLIVDAAMNDFLRPALYDAWHEIRPACI